MLPRFLSASLGAAARGASLAIPYGPSPRQTIDLFPTKDDGNKTPLALFIHGGWWRSLDPSMFSQVAAGPNAHGVTVAIVGYDLCPQVPISDIIQQICSACLILWGKRRQRFMVYGHSAGGHLAACLAAQDWQVHGANMPADLVPAAYAISGVFDLAPLTQISVNDDLKLDAKSARELSPLYWPVPAGRTLDAVVGALESSEFFRQSHAIVDGWKTVAQTRYEEIAGANHFTVVDPLADSASAMTRRVVELAKQAGAMPL